MTHEAEYRFPNLRCAVINLSTSSSASSSLRDSAVLRTEEEDADGHVVLGPGAMVSGRKAQGQDPELITTLLMIT